MCNGIQISLNHSLSKEHCHFLASKTPSPPPFKRSHFYTAISPNSSKIRSQFSPAVFISVVESVGTTLRGTAGLGERAGELGSHELRSSKENFSCKSNVAVDSNRGDWVSGHLGSTGLSQQHGGQGSTFLSDPSPDEVEHT